MSFREDVLAALSHEGQSHKQLREKLGPKHSISNISAALKDLEEAGLAKRETTPRPRTWGKFVDLKHRPRVVWRRAEWVKSDGATKR